MELQTLVADIRKNQGMSIMDIAEYVGVSHTIIYRCKNGKQKKMSHDSFRKLQALSKRKPKQAKE